MKKIIVSSDVLKPALKKLGQAVNEKSLLPVLKNIYCKVSAGQLEMITTDRELTISIKCTAETKDEFQFLLPYDFMHKVIGEMKSEPLTIEHPSARKARIVGENDVFELNSLDKLDDYPNVPAIPKKGVFRLNEEFVKQLHRAMLTVSDNKMMNHLNKVCLDMKSKEAFLVGTDAHFLFRYRMPIESAEPLQLLLSPKTAKALEGMKDFELSWTAKQVCFKGETTCVWSQRFDDKYPNYEAVIPSYPANLELDKIQLTDALRKACLSSLGTKQTSLLLKREPGRIHFDVDDTEMSRRINVSIPGEYTGEATAVSINAKKMLTVLEQVDAQKIKLHILKPEKAVVISTDEDENYLGLVMPLLINAETKPA